MKHLSTFDKYKIFERFIIESNSIKIYHGAQNEESCTSILSNGYDVEKRFSGRAEGPGMGAFFSPEETLYGEWVIEFEIPLDLFKRYVIIFFEKNRYSKSVEEPRNLALQILGREESLEEQISRIAGDEYLDLAPKFRNAPHTGWANEDIGKIKGWVSNTRFDDRLVIHLRDPSIAKPLRYFKK